MVHRKVASSVNGIHETLELKVSHATGQAISDADRLVWIFFSEYDPYDSEIQGSIVYQSGAGQDFGWKSLHKAPS